MDGENLALIKEAARLYNDFSGHNEMETFRMKVPSLPRVVAVFGDIDAIEYSTVRDGKPELYRHEFRDKSKPMFCASPDGKQIYILGGKYRVTERGIEDR